MCCGELVEICEESCAAMFPMSGRMTVESYVDFYEGVHGVVCKDKYKM
jgi:hypothetical protein